MTYFDQILHNVIWKVQIFSCDSCLVTWNPRLKSEMSLWSCDMTGCMRWTAPAGIHRGALFEGIHSLSLYIYIFQMIEITKIISQNYWLVFTNRFPEMTVNRQGATLQQFYSASQLSKLNKLTREPKRNLKLTWDATHSSWISLASLKTKEPLLTNLVVFCCDLSGYVV